MKVSEITIRDICRQIREEENYLTVDDVIHLEALEKSCNRICEKDTLP